MNSIRLFLFLGIGLSMDTFSLSIIYGTNSIRKSTRFLLSILVGSFHFFMPILGFVTTSFITKNININADLVTGIIFLILGVDMIIKDEEEKNNNLGVLEALLFSISVSLDSLSIGVALGLQKENIILASIIFSVCSFLFTVLGLSIGKRIREKLTNKTNLLGVIILFFLALKYIIKSI